MTKFFKQFALLVASFAWFVAPAQADWITKTGKPAEVKPKPPKPRMARPALWKVVDKDTTIYLFGTIHLLPGNIVWYRGKVEQAMRESDTLVTEIPGNDAALVQSTVLRTAMLPKGETLRAMLPPADAALLEKTLTQYGLTAAAMDNYEPWFAAIALSDLPLSRENFNVANGVEAQLGQKSKQLSQTHEGLETIEYQLGIFDRLPRKTQLAYLHEVLIGVPKMRQELAQLVNFWSSGKVDNLAKLMNEDEQLPEMAQVLIYNRNRSWSEWIRRRMAKPGKVFVAVGAGHLAGIGSVQAYLFKQGLTATRIQ